MSVTLLKLLNSIKLFLLHRLFYFLDDAEEEEQDDGTCQNGEQCQQDEFGCCVVCCECRECIANLINE
jgi:hypothetical protein